MEHCYRITAVYGLRKCTIAVIAVAVAVAPAIVVPVPVAVPVPVPVPVSTPTTISPCSTVSIGFSPISPSGLHICLYNRFKLGADSRTMPSADTSQSQRIARIRQLIAGREWDGGVKSAFDASSGHWTQKRLGRTVFYSLTPTGALKDDSECACSAQVAPPS